MQLLGAAGAHAWRCLHKILQSQGWQRTGFVSFFFVWKKFEKNKPLLTFDVWAMPKNISKMHKSDGTCWFLLLENRLQDWLFKTYFKRLLSNIHFRDIVFPLWFFSTVIEMGWGWPCKSWCSLYYLKGRISCCFRWKLRDDPLLRQRFTLSQAGYKTWN